MKRPTSTKMNRIPVIILGVALLFGAVISAQASVIDGGDEPYREDAGEDFYLPLVHKSGRSFYLSPTGDDSHSGTSPGQGWATFDHAWTVLQPGDNLILLDGTYTPETSGTIVPNIRNGEPGEPITIKADNDGKAIIDGQGVAVPVSLKREDNGWRIGDHFVIEGIVAKNSSESVYWINGDHNVLRRVSGYNANTDENHHVFWIWGNDNLIEDCAASGTGRKMILIFEGEHNTVRRCLADWRQWDGRNWSDCWPWGENIEIYNADNNIIENSIANGNTPNSSVSLLSQSGVPSDLSDSSSGNKILGTMSIRSGMKADDTPMVWSSRPQPTEYTCEANVTDWASHMSGFGVSLGRGIVRDNLLQDIFSWGNARYGLSVYRSGGDNDDYGNNHVVRATIINGGLNNPSPSWGGNGANAEESELAFFDSIQNSYIENIWTGGSNFFTQEGEGARLTNRYVDGVLTNEPLWPWPMEDRIQAELGYSVTELMTDIISLGSLSVEASHLSGIDRGYCPSHELNNYSFP